jgi:hypothetical protein
MALGCCFVRTTLSVLCPRCWCLQPGTSFFRVILVFEVWSVKCQVSSAWAHGVFVRPDSLAAVLLMFGLHAASSPLITVNELLAVQWALPISEMHTNLWPVLHVWKETSWKVRPVTLLEVLEGSKGIATLSWTSALDRVGYQRHVLPYRRERDPVPTVQEAGW